MRVIKLDAVGAGCSVQGAENGSSVVCYLTRRRRELLVYQLDPSAYEPPLYNPPVQVIHGHRKNDETLEECVIREVLLQAGCSNLETIVYIGSSLTVIGHQSKSFISAYVHVELPVRTPDLWSNEFEIEGDEPGEHHRLYFSFISFFNPALDRVSAAYLPELISLLQESK